LQEKAMEANMGYLAVGLGAVWVILIGYLIRLGARQEELRQQVEALEASRDSRGSGPASGR
jgi:CcmD family protein